MEDGQDDPGKGPGTPPEQPGDDGQVKGRAGPAEGVGEPELVKQRADNWNTGVLGQPDAQRRRLEQPIRVELGQAGEAVDEGDLRAKRPDSAARDRRWRTAAPRVQRPDAMGGQQEQQQAGETDEVVVVEVGGFVDQLDVGEAEREEQGGGAVAPAEHDREGEQAERGEMEMHPGRGPGAHPLEADVAEMVRGIDVELVNPAVGEEANDSRQGDDAEGDPKYGGGRAVDRLGGSARKRIKRGERARNCRAGGRGASAAGERRRCAEAASYRHRYR